MPVGAIIGGVASIGGALIGGSKNSKAINKASDAQAAATKEATALQRDIYNKNVGFQTPYLNTGNAAMGQINALLGLNVPQAPAQTAPATTTQTTQQSSADRINALPNSFGSALLKMVLAQQQGQQPAQTNPTGTAPAPVPATPTTQESANAAYDQFKGFTGYQTRLNEGMNAINSGYAANGTLQSGAAMQALNKYGQDYASNEFGNYMGYLGGQQQLGPGAANALAGVGTNYANAAGNLAIQNGQNIANAAIAKANNTNSMISGIAGGIGGALGGIKF